MSIRTVNAEENREAELESLLLREEEPCFYSHRSHKSVRKAPKRTEAKVPENPDTVD